MRTCKHRERGGRERVVFTSDMVAISRLSLCFFLFLNKALSVINSPDDAFRFTPYIPSKTFSCSFQITFAIFSLFFSQSRSLSLMSRKMSPSFTQNHWLPPTIDSVTCYVFITKTYNYLYVSPPSWLFLFNQTSVKALDSLTRLHMGK